MATHVWQGGMAAVAQVDTLTPANVEVDDVFTATINDKSISFTATAATVGNVTAGITAAWNASTEPEFAEITATDSTTHVTLTADTAGVPFTVTATETDGGGTDDQTFTRAASTANAGPNLWIAGNFDSNTLPANGDTVIFENNNIDCLYLLDQSGVNLAALTIKQSYTGKIGLPEWNANNYGEYRTTYLKLNDCTAVTIGQGEGNGSGRLKIDAGSNAASGLTVWNKGTRAETGIPCMLYKAGHADGTVTVIKGDVGVAIFGSETATVKTLQVGYLDSRTGDSTVICGDGVTLNGAGSTVTVDGGEVDLGDNAVLTVTQTGGEVTLDGSATCTTWHLDGGTAYYKSTGTLTTVNVGGGGSLDFRRDMGSRTVTNCSVYQGYAIHDPLKTVTWSNGIDHTRCSPMEGTFDVGQHQTVKLEAI